MPKDATNSIQDIARAWATLSSDGDVPAKRLTHKMLLAGVAINRENESWCREKFGLGRGEINVLMALRRAPQESMRPTDLFLSLSLSSAGITKQLDSLEGRGLVQRDNHPGHRGGFLVRLTQIGRLIADTAHEGVDTCGPMAQTLHDLPAEEQVILEGLLDKLLAASRQEAQVRKSRSKRLVKPQE